MKPQLIHVAEPDLQFRFDQVAQYPRDGLYLFGPVDAQAQPRQIKYGVIGTPDSQRRFQDWVSSISRFIEVPPPGKRTKKIAPHHVPFPGFNEAFFASLPVEASRAINDIRESDLRDMLRLENRHEAIKKVVDVFVERLAADRKRHEDPPDFWYVVIPEFVYVLGRPKSTVAKGEQVKGEIRISESKAQDLARQPSMYGDWEEQAKIFAYARNFRRQLKARLLDHQIVTQIVRETTLTPNEFLKPNTLFLKRPVEDPATIAWKLGTASYYKSGGRPWQLANVRSGVCYVGLVYKQQPKQGDPDHACCAAQMFLSDGEGIVFRGALGPWYQRDTKQFHLDGPAAEQLIKMVLTEYRSRHPKEPNELFIHAKSSFSDEEWSGFTRACKGLSTNLVGVQIADAWDQLKLFRQGSYPTIRGTAMLTGTRSAYLWTSGYVPRLDTYMGPDTPNPLSVSIRKGDANLQTVLSDILSLTKINFNSCLFNDRQPVTIRFADAIGDILVSAPVLSEPRLPFKFYI